MCKQKSEYKYPFDNFEFNKINTIENDDMRYSLMSVYAHIKKNITLHMSYAILLKEYNRKAPIKLALTTFKRRISKLIDLGLIAVKILEKKSFFTLVGQNVDQKVDQSELGSRHTNTTVIEDVGNVQIRNINNTLDIDILNTSSEVAPSLPIAPTNSVIEFLGDSYEKVESWEDIANDLEDAFKEARLRKDSHKIKFEVIRKIENNLNNITKRFAYSYILKTVLQTKEHFKNLRDSYKKATLKDRVITGGEDDYVRSNAYLFEELEGV